MTKVMIPNGLSLGESGPDRLGPLLRALLPAAMAEDFDAHVTASEEDAKWLAEQLTAYLTADETAQADILAFHEGGGVEQIKDSIERLGGGPEKDEGATT